MLRITIEDGVFRMVGTIDEIDEFCNYIQDGITLWGGSYHTKADYDKEFQFSIELKDELPDTFVLVDKWDIEIEKDK